MLVFLLCPCLLDAVLDMKVDNRNGASVLKGHTVM